MAERRAEARVRAQLRVEVSGSDAHCNRFHETVLASSLSQSGALLTNVQAELRCGHLLAVEYGGQHAFYRIVWVLGGAEGEGTEVAIQRLAGQICPWESVLPPELAPAHDLEGS